MPEIQKQIENVVDTILEDYRGNRDIDKMEALGIYEVAPEDFALCEFVDSSKLELQHIVRKGLDDLREEMA